MKSEGQIPLQWYVLTLRVFIHAKPQRLKTTLGAIKEINPSLDQNVQ